MDSSPCDLSSGCRGYGGDRLSTMTGKLRKLDRKRNKLYYEIQLERHRLLQPSIEKEIIAFVKTLEKAHQYFDFLEFLRENSENPEYFTDGLDYRAALALLPQKLGLHALSKADISAAIRSHFCNRYVPKHLSPLNQLEEGDPYAFSNPVFRVVVLSRTLEYNMDSLPERELQKIKDSSKNYHDYFIFSDPVFMPSEKYEGVVSRAKWLADKVGEACNKYNELVSRRSKDVKASASGKVSEDRGTSDGSFEGRQIEKQIPFQE